MYSGRLFLGSKGRKKGQAKRQVVSRQVRGDTLSGAGVASPLPPAWSGSPGRGVQLDYCALWEGIVIQPGVVLELSGWEGKTRHGARLGASPPLLPTLDVDHQLPWAQIFHPRAGQEEKSDTLPPLLSYGPAPSWGRPKQTKESGGGGGSPFGGREPQAGSGRSPCPPAPDSALR